MDPGHTDFAKARAEVEASGLFDLEQGWGKDMLPTKRGGAGAKAGGDHRGGADRPA